MSEMNIRLKIDELQTEIGKTVNEAYEEGKLVGRADAIDEFSQTKMDVLHWLINRQDEGYVTSNGELFDHIYEIAEKMKEGAE